jgi:hypothetical protein
MEAPDRPTTSTAPPREAVWPSAAEVFAMVLMTWAALILRGLAGSALAASWSHGAASVVLFGALFVAVSGAAVVGILGISAVALNFVRAVIGR